MTKARKIKAESFDLMQYLYGAVHAPLIRALINFSGHLDEGALKKAVNLSGKAIPLITCCFNDSVSRPRWEERGFTADDIVHTVTAGPDAENQAEHLLASTIDTAREPPLRIYLLRGRDADTLCVIINHMVCDGAGFKEYLYLLSSLYAGCETKPEAIPGLVSASRGTGQLFAGFNFFEKLGISFSKYDLSKQREQAVYALQGDRANPFFVIRQIDREGFTHIKACAGSRGATVNDMILTAYARVLSRKTGNDRIVIPCPVDLRKYIPAGRPHGICNLTTNYFCDVTINGRDSFDETLKQVSGQMKRQKLSRDCLKSVIMLEASFRFIPFSIMQKVFGKVFTVPVLSFTNLGIIDKDLLRFGDSGISGAFLTDTIKYAPYFQLAVSTYDGVLTLRCNLHGTPQDKERIADFLDETQRELDV